MGQHKLQRAKEFNGHRLNTAIKAEVSGIVQDFKFEQLVMCGVIVRDKNKERSKESEK